MSKNRYPKYKPHHSPDEEVRRLRVKELLLEQGFNVWGISFTGQQNKHHPYDYQAFNFSHCFWTFIVLFRWACDFDQINPCSVGRRKRIMRDAQQHSSRNGVDSHCDGKSTIERKRKCPEEQGGDHHDRIGKNLSSTLMKISFSNTP